MPTAGTDTIRYAPQARTVADYIALYAAQNNREAPTTSAGNHTATRIRKGLSKIKAWLPTDAPILHELERKPSTYLPDSVTGKADERHDRQHLVWTLASEDIYTDGLVIMLPPHGKRALQSLRDVHLRRATRKRSSYRAQGMSKEEAEAAELRRWGQEAQKTAPNWKAALPTWGEDHPAQQDECRELKLTGFASNSTRLFAVLQYVDDPAEHVFVRFSVWMTFMTHTPYDTFSPNLHFWKRYGRGAIEVFGPKEGQHAVFGVHTQRLGALMPCLHRGKLTPPVGPDAEATTKALKKGNDWIDWKRSE